MVSAKKSFGAKENLIAMVRGFPEVGFASMSGRVTVMEVRASAKRAESVGVMNWSISGGLVSRTRGQKEGIEEVRAERLA